MATKNRESVYPVIEPSVEALPPLWSHQKSAIEKATANGNNKFALFFEMGTGKTRTVLELIRKEDWVTRVLVVAPIQVCRNWPNEIKKYLQLPFTISLVTGTSNARIRTIKEFSEAPSPHSVYGRVIQFLIVNIETLRTANYRSEIYKSGCSVVVVDESHNFKSPTSLQTKGLFDVVGQLKPAFLYLLTGTPAPNSEMDLWSTFRLLGKTKEPYFVWRKKYFEDKNARRFGMRGYWPDFRIRESSKMEFRGLLDQCSITARKDEVLDLPPLLRTNVYCELSPVQRKHYETMEEYLFAIDSEGNELNAANILTRTLRMQQIVAGLLGEEPIADNPRLSALEYAIQITEDDNKAQFIIWTVFERTYKQIAAILDAKSITFGMLVGEVTAATRQQYVEEFQAGNLRAIIAHPRVGGEGINLNAASYSIHYTKSFSLTHDLQCEARNYRGGSEKHKKVTRIDIVAQDTVDEDINEALADKKDVQDFILGLKGKYGR